MTLKKTQLYRSLWQSCDELRGPMDASQYKDYILTLLFMKYVSDKYAGDPDALIEVPNGGGFADLAMLKGDEEIGDKINKIIRKLAAKNDLVGVINLADFNDGDKLGSGAEMVDRLSKLITIFEGLDFKAKEAGGDDLLGDMYEYLMHHFAAASDKSKGAFYTPAEVSRVVAQVVGIGPETRKNRSIYDPTCGSGSLLITAVDESPRGLAVFGQEMDSATWALARMNMILHNQGTADLCLGNTLAAPSFKNKNGSLKAFDFAVANPPFTNKAWTTGLNPDEDEFDRFECGIPPAKNGDCAYLLHLIKSLKDKGKGAIILPLGVLSRGHSEADIRRELIKCGYIKGIIGLPANLFYGTGVPACIIVIDKEDAETRTGIFMIDASKGFLKDGGKNRLRAQDIRKIVDVFTGQTKVPGYARMVPVRKIASMANEYKLDISRYIESSEPKALHDPAAHLDPHFDAHQDADLNGDIPNAEIDALKDYWKVFPSLRETLFEESDRAGYSTLRVESHGVLAAVLAHEEFATYSDRVTTIAKDWRTAHTEMLMGLVGSEEPVEPTGPMGQADEFPGHVIDTLAEDLLERFAKTPLLDAYDIYQRLLDYWVAVMEDDVQLVAAAGWLDAARPRLLEKGNDGKFNETPDLTFATRFYKMDLVGPELIMDRFFSRFDASRVLLTSKRDAARRTLAEFTDEQTREGGLLVDAVNAQGKVTKGAINARFKVIGDDPACADNRGAMGQSLKLIKDDPAYVGEREALGKWLKLIEAETKAGKILKGALSAMNVTVIARYSKLTEDEVKSLAVDDKWFGSIESAIASEVERMTQAFAGRVQTFAERYAPPLPEPEPVLEPEPLPEPEPEPKPEPQPKSRPNVANAPVPAPAAAGPVTLRLTNAAWPA